ncbi:MAG: DCC1-like thiol-disulfide oxidoreductase family protein [Actinomycetota bacterium]
MTPTTHAGAAPARNRAGETDTGWPPRRLTVIYDDHCELCVRCADWLSVQPAHVELRFLPSSDPAVFDRYGELPWFRLELMVVTDLGEAWIGGEAFIMCLWSTMRWHRFSYQLSGRALAPLAERFFHALSANRSVVSGLLTPTRCTDGTCGHG